MIANVQIHKVGFTGTQQGMTDEQKAKFVYLIKSYDPTVFHHGDCVGADEQAHDLVVKYSPRTLIEIWPPRNPSKRAWCKGHVVHREHEYLERNEFIVLESQLMIATPLGAREVLLSGTWSTIRFARRMGKSLRVIRSDGKIL